MLRVQEKHGGKFDCSKLIYIHSDIKIEVICRIHGSFYPKPSDFLKQGGCPKCWHPRIKQHLWLDSYGLPDSKEHREVYMPSIGKKNSVDGFDRQTNTVYEFWGDFWHGNPEVFDPSEVNKMLGKTFKELYEKTMDKRMRIFKAGFKLIEIWENDWDKKANDYKEKSPNEN
jgi:hypothetical protein